MRPLSDGEWTSGLLVHVEADSDASNPLTPADTLVRQFAMPSPSYFDASNPGALAFDAQGRNVALTLDGAPQISTLVMTVNGRSRTVTIGRTGSTTIGPVN